MIEDRKFGQEITDEYKPFDVANDDYGKPAPFVYLKNSPWKVIGPKNTVTMEKTDAYVGEWSPVIHLPGNGTDAGISQGNEPFNGAGGFLAVEKGKKYVGHIVLAGDAEVGPVTVKLGNPDAFERHSALVAGGGRDDREASGSRIRWNLRRCPIRIR